MFARKPIKKKKTTMTSFMTHIAISLKIIERFKRLVLHATKKAKRNDSQDLGLQVDEADTCRIEEPEIDEGPLPLSPIPNQRADKNLFQDPMSPTHPERRHRSVENSSPSKGQSPYPWTIRDPERGSSSADLRSINVNFSIKVDVARLSQSTMKKFLSYAEHTQAITEHGLALAEGPPALENFACRHLFNMKPAEDVTQSGFGNTSAMGDEGSSHLCHSMDTVLPRSFELLHDDIASSSSQEDVLPTEEETLEYGDSYPPRNLAAVKRLRPKKMTKFVLNPFWSRPSKTMISSTHDKEKTLTEIGDVIISHDTR
jgi:hypothetical protein